MSDAIGRVMERFPAQAAAIAKLAGESEAFQSICEGYELASETLRRFEASPTDNRRKLIAEYRILVRDLEQEIERALMQDEHPSAPVDRDGQ